MISHGTVGAVNGLTTRWAAALHRTSRLVLNAGWVTGSDPFEEATWDG